MRPRIVRSPVDICFGTRPSHAAKSRPCSDKAKATWFQADNGDRHDDDGNHPAERHPQAAEDLAEEQKNVRVWGGVHYRLAIRTSEDVGRKVAAYMIENTLKPVR